MNSSSTDLYDELVVKKELLSSSICKLLFGDNQQKIRETLYNSKGYLRIMFYICQFYSTIIQAYYIALAQSNSIILKKIIQQDDVYKSIRELWKSEYDRDVKINPHKVFSQLNDFFKINDQSILSNEGKDIILKLNEAIKNPSYKSDPFDRHELLLLVKSFCLLPYTEIDQLTKSLVFSLPNQKKISIPYKPFLIFMNPETRFIDDKAGRPFLFLQAMKGERNEEYRFAVAEIILSQRELETTIITMPIDEDIYHLYYTLNISSKWIAICRFEGTLKCLSYLVYVTDHVIYKKLIERKHREYDDNEDLFGDIRELFIDTELYEMIEYQYVIPSDIDKFLYDLFIKFGVFKTMTCLLIDSRTHKHTEMLDLYLKEFGSQKSEEELSTYKTSFNSEQRYRISSLQRIVPKDSAYYEQREKEINAEECVKIILQIAGFDTNDLIPKIEDILSIDDYFDMIKNIHTSKEESLRRILLFLISFYTPLISANFRQYENNYYSEMNKIQESISSLSSLELFEKFIELDNNSYRNENIQTILGRDAICQNRNDLVTYMKDIKDYIEAQNIKRKNGVVGKYMFISYAHADQEIVRQAHNLLKPETMLVYDEDHFSNGIFWEPVAKELIEDKDCIGVICFISKKAVMQDSFHEEISFANDWAKKKYTDKKDQDNFIYTINLESQNISDYLYNIRSQKSITERERDLIKNFQKIYPSTRIFSGLADNYKDDIIERFKNCEDEGFFVDYESFDMTELTLANFYTFLKTGINKRYDSFSKVKDAFEKADLSRCIYPFVISIKEEQIKRDNITLLGYEILRGKGRRCFGGKYILSSKKLSRNDYYCIPHYNQVGIDCSWMREPFLVMHNQNNQGDNEKNE